MRLLRYSRQESRFQCLVYSRAIGADVDVKMRDELPLLRGGLLSCVSYPAGVQSPSDGIWDRGAVAT